MLGFVTGAHGVTQTGADQVAGAHADTDRDMRRVIERIVQAQWLRAVVLRAPFEQWFVQLARRATAVNLKRSCRGGMQR